MSPWSYLDRHCSATALSHCSEPAPHVSACLIPACAPGLFVLTRRLVGASCLPSWCPRCHPHLVRLPHPAQLPRPSACDVLPEIPPCVLLCPHPAARVETGFACGSVDEKTQVQLCRPSPRPPKTASGRADNPPSSQAPSACAQHSPRPTSAGFQATFLATVGFSLCSLLSDVIAGEHISLFLSD